MTKRQPKQDLFSAITLVSPARMGGESKDQDRALWYTVHGVAALSDGVSDSHCGAEAAQCAVDYAPALFARSVDPKARLRTLADLLYAKRREASRRGMLLPESASPAMRELLHDASQRALENSFQATLVTAAFIPADDRIDVNIVVVGDSAFFAFDHDGDTLLTTLDVGAPTPPIKEDYAAFPLRPGDELICRILGDGNTYPHALEQSGVRTKSPGKWLICAPRDVCNGAILRLRSTVRQPDVALRTDDLLVVPHHLAERFREQSMRHFCRVRYSSGVRRVSAPIQVPARLDQKSVFTAVVPDHIGTSQCRCLRERFPADTQFVLASDGFYSAFTTPQELWNWFQEHGSELGDHERPHAQLNDLHQRLQDRQGDDDMSFIWVRLANADAGTAEEDHLFKEIKHHAR
ncbi:MAG: hypothetical protein NTU53_23145 [Planctomycetota bacterium]|nr:hypothetical protein [Planctomycetota bacterium]